MKKRGLGQKWEVIREIKIEDFQNSDEYRDIENNFVKQTKKVTKEGVVSTYWCRLSKRKGYKCKCQMRTKESCGSVKIERNNIQHMHQIESK